MPHQIVGVTPPQFIHIPSELSFWDNSQYGDCVTAEEAFAKACHQPEIFIPQNTVVAWAEAHGVLNGAYLNAVLQMMLNGGFKQSGHTYDDGPAHTVDWTNAAVLNNAIFTNCPVKIGWRPISSTLSSRRAITDGSQPASIGTPPRIIV